MIAAATAWFDNNRSLAVSLVSAGMGVAPMTISPFARWLITTYDWRTAMLTIGILAWVLLIPAALLVRRPPARQRRQAAQGPPPAIDGAGWSVARRCARRSSSCSALTFFACCAAHSGPIFHMVSYAMFCGVAPMAAVSIYSVEGLCGLGGRLLLGVLADRLGAKPVLITGLMVQALAIGTYLVVSRLGEFYALAVIFGTAYGGVMPLYAVLAREYFGQNIMGTVFGAATMLSSIGMAFGPWPAAGSSIPSMPTPGCSSARSASGSARWRSRSPSRRCPRASDCSQHEGRLTNGRSARGPACRPAPGNGSWCRA